MSKQARRLSTPIVVLVVVLVLLSFAVVFWISECFHMPQAVQLKLLARWSLVPVAAAAFFGCLRDWNLRHEKP